MRRLVRILLLRPILWASNKFASRPEPHRIFTELTELLNNIKKTPGKKGITLKIKENSRFIIFSDQHRGAKNGADDFMLAEPNYLAALEYYYQHNYHFISLGDNEELWENSLARVKKFNTITFEAEKKFIQQKRFYKVFGNHDLYWANDPLAWWQLKNIYGQKVKVFEGMVLQLAVNSSEFRADTPDSGLRTPGSQLTIFLTHGHQGDASSDGNWFSKFFVSNIWAPLQAYLKINPNTPAYDEDLKTEHNRIMYEWSAQQKNLLLITGHTHQPVFASLTHLERLYMQLDDTIKNNRIDEKNKIEVELSKRKRNHSTISSQYLSMKSSYFNSGCCCFSDGDCTGIEITHEKISLIKWSGESGREVLEEARIIDLIKSIQ